MKIFGMYADPTALALAAFEFLIFGLVFSIAFGVVPGLNSMFELDKWQVAQLLFMVAALMFFTLIALDAYERRNRRSLKRTLIRLSVAGLFAFIFILVTLPLHGTPSILLAAIIIAAMGLVILIRWIGIRFNFLLAPLHGRKLIIGNNIRTTKLCEQMPGRMKPYTLHDVNLGQGAALADCTLGEFIRGRRIDTVILATDDPNKIMEVLDSCDHGLPSQAIIDDVAFLESITGKFDLVKSKTVAPQTTMAYELAKRMLDIVLSLVMIVILLPILLMSMLAVKVTSAGTVFFQQRRMGKDGQAFMLLKLRTMIDRPRSGINGKNTSEFTPIGGFLRRSRLDELPQLFNILKGDMSLVGPRPEQAALIERFAREIPRYNERHQVKPGLTGWAQIRQGHCDEDANLHEVKVSYDLYYLRHRSFWFDLFILSQTLSVVIFGDDDREPDTETAVTTIR